MKKYIKPELIYERYELSQHIADCAWELNNGRDEYGCNVAYADQDKLPGLGTLFTLAYACDIKTDQGEWEDYCYQGGSSTGNVFNS